LILDDRKSQCMEQVIFLAGGGDEKDSAELDKIFVDTLQERRIEKLVYVPIALTSRSYNECLKWFSSIFAGKVSKIEMWEDLTDKKIAGREDQMAIYFGGGDTRRLLKLVCDSLFDNEIKKFAVNGGILYGGSAGAIFLGRSIKTAPEVKSARSVKGLGLISSLSIACHFEPKKTEDVMALAGRIGMNILAIEENAGAIFQGGQISPVGLGEIHLISGKDKKVVNSPFKV